MLENVIRLPAQIDDCDNVNDEFGFLDISSEICKLF